MRDQDRCDTQRVSQIDTDPSYLKRQRYTRYTTSETRRTPRYRVRFS